MAGLVHIITFSCSAMNSIIMVYFALDRSKLQYFPVTWNSVVINDSDKRKDIHRDLVPFVTVQKLCSIIRCNYMNVR